jgi:23S rRNA maturation mini-RNase III
VTLLSSLLEGLPEELARQVFTHASWTERRSESYLRLAFLGDSVLALAITAHLYPRLEAERFGAGRLTKIRAQTVSGRSCRAVAERLNLLERLRAAAPENGEGRKVELLETDRVLASVLEAVIGACYLNAGYERTAEAVVEAFAPEIEHALEHPCRNGSLSAGRASHTSWLGRRGQRTSVPSRWPLWSKGGRSAPASGAPRSTPSSRPPNKRSTVWRRARRMTTQQLCI